jgi:lysophospholipase L1-like esterase
MKIRICILAILLFLISGKNFAQNQTRFIEATNPAFQYIGRVDKTTSAVNYNWPGVTISTTFTGDKLGIKLKGGEKNYFNIWVDDQLVQVVRAVNDTVWWFPSRLKKQKHQLRLVKRTEADMGIATFYGIFIAEEGKVSTPVNSSSRKILFIGNSITCGYGAEGKSKTEHFSPATENCEKSYATIIARAFDANFQLVSHSGLGLVRNYGDKNKRSKNPMPSRLNYLFDNDSTRQIELSDFRPDAIVINLGTNDFSTHPFPDETDFTDAGEKLLVKLTNTFPETNVFCITGPMINEPCYQYTKKYVENFRSKYNNAHVVFIGVPVDLMNDNNDLGSDYHPSYRGQLKTANLILPVMATVLNWDYSKKELTQISENP